MAADLTFHLALAAASAFFAVEGVLHGKFNSYYKDDNEVRRGLLRAYYISVLIFLAFIVGEGVRAGRTPLYDVIGTAFLVAVVHSARAYTDWLDLQGRRVRFPAVRQTVDAGANYLTILLAIFAYYLHDAWGAWLGAFFATMFIAREFYFRMKGDFFDRKGGTVTTSQGGSGPPTNPVLTMFQAFIGRYLKSYFYITVGFAMLYLLLPTMMISSSNFYAQLGSGADDPLDALWFSIGVMTFTFPARLPVVAEMIAISQFLAASILVSMIGVTIFTEGRSMLSPNKK